jgi:hypothetical protein
MRRRFFLLLALAGMVWLYLRRGARRPQTVDQVPPPADPAGVLRRKLDETRERDEDTPASHVAEPEPAEPWAPVVSEELDARRREIHERARSATEEMGGSSSD